VASDTEVTHDRQARLHAIETGAVVVSVDYRRPAETYFPGAFEDSFAVLRDVSARNAEFDGARRRQSGGGGRGAIAGLSRHRCRRKQRGPDREGVARTQGLIRDGIFPAGHAPRSALLPFQSVRDIAAE
jgi:hypothetical protein